MQSRQYEFAHYYKTKNYIGSAGGFRRGMAIAHENGFDWVWLLDQDSTVSPNCLIALLKCAKKGDLLCDGYDRLLLDGPFFFVGYEDMDYGLKAVRAGLPIFL